MSKLIDRIRAKVTRAKQHIHDFQLAVSAFNDTDPDKVLRYDEAARGKRVYRVAKVDPVSNAMTTIAADVIQNLRSPLDPIAFQLVKAGPVCDGTEPKWKVYYPICGSSTYYPSARGGIAKHVRQEVIDAIDATEPYKGGKGHALWQLNALANPDKHQVPLSAGVMLSGVDVSVYFRDYLSTIPGMEDKAAAPFRLFGRPIGKLSPLKLGDELMTEPLNVKVVHEREFTFDVTLHEPGIIECEPALKTFQDMANLVDDIVTKLGRFLP